MSLYRLSQMCYTVWKYVAFYQPKEDTNNLFCNNCNAFGSSSKIIPLCLSRFIWSVKVWYVWDKILIRFSYHGYIKIKSSPWARCSYGKRGKHVAAKITEFFCLTKHSYIVYFSFHSWIFLIKLSDFGRITFLRKNVCHNPNNASNPPLSRTKKSFSLL